MAHTEGHKMVMGSKEKNTPGNFSSVATDLINSAPQSKLKYSDGGMEGDTRGLGAQYGGNLSSLRANTSELSAPKTKPESKKLTKAGEKQQKLAKKRDAKIMQAKTERKLGNYELGKQRSKRAGRIQKRIDRRAKRFSKKQ